MDRYLIQGISLPYTEPAETALREAEKRIAAADSTALDAHIYRRSVDARNKSDIRFVYSVVCSAQGNRRALERAGAVPEKSGFAVPAPGSEKLRGRPLICGFGPAGMFAALILAENGYRPIVCERGPSPAERQKKIDHFFRTGELDTEGNVQFGAGGAGMFSDGKLMTRINDPLCRYVLERMRDHGAPDDILVNARPHVGTDVLSGVVARFAERIESCGGEILYGTRVDELLTAPGGRVRAVRTPQGEFECGAVVLAVGHSARDTYAKLISAGYGLVPKPVSVGFRIEHLRADIDRALYGDRAGDPLLGAAEYNLSARVGSAGVYTFCMCPGGDVVAAASENGGVVTNGASRFARDGVNSNAAVAITFSPPDPLEFQRTLERAAFAAGGGEFAAPVQTVGDFLSGKSGTDPSRVEPSYTRGRVKPANVAAILPQNSAEIFAAGLRIFGRRIEGYDAPDAVITGLETRTTAPYRIPRGECLSMKEHDNVYPCGEGAGWAGGITSAAVDGVKTAFEIIKRYDPNLN